MGLDVVKTLQVLMACYQGEACLPRQLDTLRAQDDPCFTVLLQDDGSADGTPALLREVCAADSRFRLAQEQGRHLGAVGNFLSLMRQSDADYSALCDQDDEWLPHRLSRCRSAMEAAEARFGADTPLLVHSDAALIDGSGALLHPSFFAHQGWRADATGLAPLLVQNNVTGCTLMMNAALRRLVVSHAGAADMHMHDWFIALTAAAFGQVIFVPEALVRYRQHGHNVMGASRAGLLRRGVSALAQGQKARERIALTYRHTAAFRRAYADDLPDAAARLADAYLATEALPKCRRVLAVQRLGCRMQSPVTRLGQILFG